ncbi:unnamed protein product [Thlaspi arvense]|uniref:CW-type domain-containing protein n=1 Tax=Thlaspi arvense TaxID=13288 RepID=A0AAU9T449_THLAR|nr:unnamed protein product [Thlaspi arvense]
MGENSELEEGEMNCSTDEAVVDLDVDLSYIDEKVQNVLGHLQKDALDRFGSRLYDYGSFLPTYKRVPAVPPPCQRSSLGNHAVQRFSNSLPAKNVVQNFQSLPTTTTSCKLVSLQKPQNNQTSGSLLTQAPGMVPIKKENARILGNDLSGHKPIRVRIKMGSEILSRNVAMVCKDLGLDDSPSVTTRKSLVDYSSGMLPNTSPEKSSESPSRIIQEMTSIPVPEDLLMSPLPDSLLFVKDKKKQYTLLGNEPVLKAGKEPSIQTQNKLSDVLGSGETPSGRRRKAVDCFDVNETSSVGEMKKQKVFSTGQIARRNSTCDLGGATSTKDGFIAESNLQKGTKKERESDPRTAFAKSNKIKVVGKHADKELKTNSTKLKQNNSKDQVLSKMPFKDAAYIGQNSMGVGLDSAVAVAPLPTSLDIDIWAQCDSCETWRLLPFGTNTEQLPKKWLCRMQTWLPGMNHCGVSMEETINAIKSLHATEARCPETVVKSLSEASNADGSYQPLTSSSLSNPVEKKPIVKNLLSQGVSSNILADPAKPIRSDPHVLKIKNVKLPLETHNATQMSTDQKAKGRSSGTGSQIKIKKKKEGDNQESEGSKQIKTGDGNKPSRDIKAEEIQWKQNLDWTQAERKKKRHGNDICTSDVERDTKKRLLASNKKPDPKPQLTTGSVSLWTKAHGRTNSLVRKIRLTGYKQGNNGSSSKLSADGEEKVPSMEKRITVQEVKARQRNEMFQADGHREHQNADASCKYFSGGSGQISGVETSSSAKVLGSHKSGRRYVEEEVKASPVESVSSFPARTSCRKNLALAGESISRQNQNLKCGDAGSKIVKNRKHLSQEADCEFLSTTHPRNRNQAKPEVFKQNSEFGDLPCTSMEKVLEIRAGIKNFSAITHETMDRSSQAANDILQEAEKLTKLADCFKSFGYDYEHKEANFKAALMFLLGASLLERCTTENVEVAKMNHVEAYHTAAKLSGSCALQYEKSQEMAAAAMAYKCVEVACMRVVYGTSQGLSGEFNELQKMVQMMTPQGESPSSSTSDVDSFCNQGVIDKSAKTKRGLSNVAGNTLPVARSPQSFAPLLDFTETMNLAMEASAKSQDAFREASVTSEETQHGDYVSAIKKVVDFSFHDVEALIQMIEVARDVLSPSKFRGPKC